MGCGNGIISVPAVVEDVDVLDPNVEVDVVEEEPEVSMLVDEEVGVDEAVGVDPPKVMDGKSVDKVLDPVEEL